MKLPTWLEYLLGLRQRPRYVTSPGTPNQPGRVRCVELKDGDSLWQGERNYLRRLGERYYEFFDPRTDRTKPAPVVMLLHGRGGNAAQARYSFQFEAEAERRGWVVIYPGGQRQGRLGGWDFNLAWNDGTGKDDPPLDDVKFLTDVLWDFKQRYMRYTHLCVGGHSNGSAMAFRYAMSDEGYMVYCLAGNAGAIAPEAGSRQTPCIYFHGVQDPVVSHGMCMDIAQRWGAHNGAVSSGVCHEIGDSECELWIDDDFPVYIWSISPGGHSIPGGKAGPHERFAEPVNQDVSWAEEVGKFSARFV